jgi:hypothetical protein
MPCKPTLNKPAQKNYTDVIFLLDIPLPAKSTSCVFVWEASRTEAVWQGKFGRGDWIMRALTVEELEFVSGGAITDPNTNKPRVDPPPRPDTILVEGTRIPKSLWLSKGLDPDAGGPSPYAFGKPTDGDGRPFEPPHYGDEDGDGDIDEIDATIFKLRNSPGGLSNEEQTSLKFDNLIKKMMDKLGNLGKEP